MTTYAKAGSLRLNYLQGFDITAINTTSGETRSVVSEWISRRKRYNFTVFELNNSHVLHINKNMDSFHWTGIPVFQGAVTLSSAENQWLC